MVSVMPSVVAPGITAPSACGSFQWKCAAVVLGRVRQAMHGQTRRDARSSVWWQPRKRNKTKKRESGRTRAKLKQRSSVEPTPSVDGGGNATHEHRHNGNPVGVQSASTIQLAKCSVEHQQPLCGLKTILDKSKHTAQDQHNTTQHNTTQHNTTSSAGGAVGRNATAERSVNA